MLTEAVFV